MKGKKLRDPLFWIGVTYMALLLLFAIFGPLIPLPDASLNPVIFSASVLTIEVIRRRDLLNCAQFGKERVCVRT